jgi:hypothetical protein
MQVANEEIVAELAIPYVKGHTDININQERWAFVERHFSLADWPMRCRSARKVATDAIVRELELGKLMQECARRLEAESVVVREQWQSRIEALANSPGEAVFAGAEFETEMLVRQALLAGIRNPGLRLDATGAIFLAGFALT